MRKIGALCESLYASAAYVKEQGGVPRDLTGLSEWSHIANDWQGTPIKYTFVSGARLTVDPRVRCNTFPQIMEFALHSLGVARIPDLVARKHVEGQRLIKVAELGSAPIYSVHNFENKPPLMVTHFLDLLRDQFRHL